MLPRSGVTALVIYFGTFLVGAGINGVVNPKHMAQVFGVANVNQDMTFFVPAFGGRTLAAGVALWWMFLAGQRKALGIFMTSWAIAGIADTYLLLCHSDEVHSVWLHVLNTGLLILGGLSLLRS